MALDEEKELWDSLVANPESPFLGLVDTPPGRKSCPKCHRLLPKNGSRCTDCGHFVEITGVELDRDLTSVF